MYVNNAICNRGKFKEEELLKRSVRKSTRDKVPCVPQA